VSGNASAVSISFGVEGRSDFLAQIVPFPTRKFLRAAACTRAAKPRFLDVLATLASFQVRNSCCGL